MSVTSHSVNVSSLLEPAVPGQCVPNPPGSPCQSNSEGIQCQQILPRILRAVVRRASGTRFELSIENPRARSCVARFWTEYLRCCHNGWPGSFRSGMFRNTTQCPGTMFAKISSMRPSPLTSICCTYRFSTLLSLRYRPCFSPRTSDGKNAGVSPSFMLTDLVECSQSGNMTWVSTRSGRPSPLTSCKITNVEKPDTSPIGDVSAFV